MWQQLQQHLGGEEVVEGEGLLEEYYCLANLNYYVLCHQDWFRCFLWVLSCAPTHDPEWGLGTVPAPACQHWLLGRHLHSHCLHVNDGVGEGECGPGMESPGEVWAVCGCGGGAEEASVGRH